MSRPPMKHIPEPTTAPTSRPPASDSSPTAPFTLDYDPDARAVYVKVSDASVVHTEFTDEHSGIGEVLIDRDAKGNLVGVEILL